MKRPPTLLFDKTMVSSLLSIPETIGIVEEAFKLYAAKKSLKLDLMHIDTDQGEFHVKGGGIKKDKTYFGLKSNGGFFQNKTRHGLPNIQGLILLADGDNGIPLAVFESSEITIQRTGALTAVAAKYLARPDAAVATICGCGIQGRIQLAAIMQVMRLGKILAYDQNAEVAQSFAAANQPRYNATIEAAPDLGQAVKASDIIITCTPSRKYFINKEDVRPGTFVAAVGADSPEKQEIEPALIAGNRVIADIIGQCVAVGDIHHAIEQGLMTEADIYADIGEIISGQKPGRENTEEIIIFDATGSALQDVACAAYVYEKAVAQNAGAGSFDFTA
jgi:alanine dehydrogenase